MQKNKQRGAEQKLWRLVLSIATTATLSVLVALTAVTFLEPSASPEVEAAYGNLDYRYGTAVSSAKVPASSTEFSVAQYTNAATFESPAQYIDTTGTSPYHEFIYNHTNTTDPTTFMWVGKASISGTLLLEQWSYSSTYMTWQWNMITNVACTANVPCAMRANSVSYDNGLPSSYVRIRMNVPPSSFTLSTNRVGWVKSYAYYNQSGYQFFNDDGRFYDSAVPSNVWRNTSSHALNAPLTAEQGQAFTIKIHAENLGVSGWYDNSAAFAKFDLEYRVGAGAWAPVSAVTPVALTEGYSHNGATLPVSLPGTNDTCAHPEWSMITWANAQGGTHTDQWTENSPSIQVASGYGGGSPRCYLLSYPLRVLPTVTAGQVVQLRLTTSTAGSSAYVHTPADFEMYTQYPTITIAATTRSFSKAGVVEAPQTGRGMWFWSNNPVFETTNAPVIPAVDASGLIHVGNTRQTPNGIVDAVYVGLGQGTGCDAGTEWTCTTIDTGTLRDYRFEAGKLRMLYSQGTSPYTVRYAEYVGTGGTGCASTTAWTCVTIAGTTKIPKKMAVTTTGTVAIVTTNNTATTGTIDYCEGTIAGGFTCRVDALAGTRPAVDFTTTNQPRISFYTPDSAYPVLSYASCSSSCATSGAWTTESIDRVSSGGAYIGDCDTSLAVDGSNTPHIGYCMRFGEALYARKSTAGEQGGCRYNGTTTTSQWRCEYVTTSSLNGRDMDVEIDPLSGRVRMTTQGTNDRNYIQQVNSGGVSSTGSTSYSHFCRNYKVSLDAVSWKLDNPSQWICEASQGSASGSEWLLNLAFSADGMPVIAGGATIGIMRETLTHSYDAGGFSRTASSDNSYDVIRNSILSPAQRRSIVQFVHEKTTSGSPLTASWEGQTSLATTTKAMQLQILRFGTTQQWETVDTENTIAANTDFTMNTSAWAPAGPWGEYYFPRGGKYYVFWRVTQEAPGTTPFENNLKTDVWDGNPTTLIVQARRSTQAGALITSPAITFDITGAWSLNNGSTTSGVWTGNVTPGSLTLTPDPSTQGTNIYNAGQSFASGSVSAGGTLTLIMVFDYSPPIVQWFQNPTPVGATTATIWGTVASNGGTTLNQTGICRSTTNQNPTIGVDTCVTVCASSCPTGNFSAAVTGLASNTLYYYRGYAINSVATSYFTTSPYSFKTLPGAPGGPTYSSPSDTGVTVSWTSPGGSQALTYQLERCQGAGCSSFAVVVASTSGTTTWQNSLTPGTTYRYRVRAYNDPGNWGAYSAITDITTAAPPTIISPTKSSISAAGATLGANVTANGGTTLSGRGTCFGTTAAPTGNCFAMTPSDVLGVFTHARSGMSSNTLYYYRGYASNTYGMSYSADDTLLTLPAAPGTPTFTNLAATSVTVNWTSPGGSGGALTYRVERCQGAGCSSFVQVAGPQAGLTFNDSGLTSGATYLYRIVANNATGNGAYSGTGTYASNTPPTVSIVTPLPPAIVVGKWYTIAGRSTDAQGGGTTTNTWSYAPGSATTGEFGAPSDVVNGNDKTTTITWRATQPGRYQLLFTSSDGVSPDQSVVTPNAVARTLPNWIEVSP